jgi:hypothetical protein
MNRFVFAAVLATLFGSRADAQVYVDTTGNPGLGFYKSGNVLVGSNGYYPYDTGDYALAGFAGLARQSGFFTMVGPGGFYGPAPFGTGNDGGAYCPPRHGHGHFRRW